MTKRIYSILICIILLVCTMAGGMTAGTANVSSGLFHKDKAITIWYTDEAITDYMAAKALEYYETNNIRVTPVLASGLQYLEKMNEEQITTGDAPDLYVVSNDLLEKAYLSGMAVEITDENSFVNAKHYDSAALNAVTYKGQRVAYPFYFETSVLLYNETYLKDMAVKTIENEQNALEGEEAMALIENADSDEELASIAASQAEASDVSSNEVTDEEITKKEEELIPNTMEGILNFADAYDAPENVESVFKWDVSDIFYNYFIVGDSMNLGGEAGDDPSQIDINNTNSYDCMTLYKSLNQFFSIDPKAVSYDSVLQEFTDGKIVFTVATTDAIAKLEKGKLDGSFQYEYGMAPIPQVSDTLSSRSLSVTNGIAVNGNSECQDVANDFATFLVESQTSDFYKSTTKIASRNDIEYELPAIDAAIAEYAASIPMPKMMQTANFWVELEIAFTKIWTGQDVNEILSQLQDFILQQISN